MNRINIITLGVSDVLKSSIFYRKLGFTTPNTEETPQMLFFNNGGTKLALYPFDELAKDIDPSFSGEKTKEGFCGFTLAYNAKTKDEVDAIFMKIEPAGGTIAKKPETVFWGGYSGYFKDLDGYFWEVAYADSWLFDENDMLVITE